MVFGDLEYKIDDPALQNGSYFYPMVIENIPKDSPCYWDELFGPVFTLFKVSSDQEAADLANDTVYGLSGVVFTTDIDRGQRLAEKVDVGGIYINEIVVTDPTIPAGGVKESGYGRECYIDGLLEISNKKIYAIAKE